MSETALGLKRDADGRYPVLRDGVVVGHVFRLRSGWVGQLVGSDDPVSPYAYRNRGQALYAVDLALDRGGVTVIKLQPAPRIDNISDFDGEEMTQLPWPLHVRSYDGKVLDGWTKRVVGFTRDLAKQQVDLWWNDLTTSDPSWAIGMYIVIQNPDGGYATLDTAVQTVEVLAAASPKV